MGELWYVGVDGGGSGTRVAACDGAGRVVFRGEGGSANHQSAARPRDNLAGPLRALEAGLERAGAGVGAAAFTMSGWDFRRDREAMTATVDGALADAGIAPAVKIIDNDIFAVLRAGLLEGERGICLIAGAGTLGAAIAPGTRFRTWGLGYESGEWGGGNEIGAEAYHRVISAGLGREEACPILEEKVLRFFGFEALADETASEMVSGAGIGSRSDMRMARAEVLAEFRGDPSFDLSRLSVFSGEVFKAAREGCPGAAQVLTMAGREYAKTVRGLLGMVGVKVPLVLGGGVFRHNGLPPGFREELGEDMGKIEDIRLLRSDPVWGSLAWACELGGIRVGGLDFLGEIKIERIEA